MYTMWVLLLKQCRMLEAEVNTNCSCYVPQKPNRCPCYHEVYEDFDFEAQLSSAATHPSQSELGKVCSYSC